MRRLTLLLVVISIAAIYILWPTRHPTAQAVVAIPRAELYASLDQLYADIERKSAMTTTVTGNPPVPVKFTFERDEGEALALTADAGLRTVRVKAWIDDTNKPGESLLSVEYEPKSLLKKSGTSDAHRSLVTILQRTSNQFRSGQRIEALFGKGRGTAEESDVGQLEAGRPEMFSDDLNAAQPDDSRELEREDFAESQD